MNITEDELYKKCMKNLKKQFPKEALLSAFPIVYQELIQNSLYFLPDDKKQRVAKELYEKGTPTQFKQFCNMKDIDEKYNYLKEWSWELDQRQIAVDPSYNPVKEAKKHAKKLAYRLMAFYIINGLIPANGHSPDFDWAVDKINKYSAGITGFENYNLVEYVEHKYNISQRGVHWEDYLHEFDTEFPQKKAKWVEGDGLVYLNNFNGGKMLGLDLDQTLITTKSGKKFPIDINDYKLLYSPEILHKYIKKGWHPAIFSNQKNTDADYIKTKITNVMKDLKIKRYSAFVSTGDNIYRKPLPYVFELFTNPGKFLFVGDASGRIQDFSDTDRKFALNIQNLYEISTKFKTPEEFFLNKPEEKFVLKGYNPKTFKNTLAYSVNCNKKEMILMVGLPASGKTSLAKLYAEECDYAYISMDALKTQVKCINAVKEALKDKRSIIIDNTNYSAGKRKLYIDLAKPYNYTIRVIQMNVPIELAKHLNYMRMIKTGSKIPTLVYNKLNKEYEAPDEGEGIDRIETQDLWLPDIREFNMYFDK